MTQSLPEKRIHLSDRAVLRISGVDAKNFLQNIITNDMEKMTCLLSPQGQYLHDFFIVQHEDHYLLDVDATGLDDLLRRLTIFKLRAKVVFENITGQYNVFAVGAGEGLPDPRLTTLGARLYTQENADGALLVGQYHDFCIDFVIPCGSHAMTTRDTMADVNLDRLNAVAWDKGCFIGQEVAARMYHRGLEKKRLFRVDGPDLVAGEKLLQNGREVGEVRHVNRAGTRAVAQIKLAAAGNELLPILTSKGDRLIVKPAKYLESAAA